MIAKPAAMIFIAVSALAQPSHQIEASAKEPNLPVVSFDACPGKGRVVPHWKISSESKIYSSWGAGITRKPDRILVTKAIPELSLTPGDIILRYWYYAEGVADIWVKGKWHKQYDLSGAVEKNGAGCGWDGWDSVVKEDGVKEGWVQVRSRSGLVGWTQTHAMVNGVFIDVAKGNFNDLCAD